MKNRKISNDECSICLQSFSEKERITTLSCNHYYHQKCIDLWLAISEACPLCRSIV